jgi:glycine/D-amino acid oxidase-like deaminating enzyme
VPALRLIALAPEVAKEIRDTLMADGICVVEGVASIGVRREGREVVVIAGAGEFRADELLVATDGVRPRKGLGSRSSGSRSGGAVRSSSMTT